MEENNPINQPASSEVLLTTDQKEFSTAPGAEVKVTLVLRNLTSGTEFLELSIQGVPLSWVSLPSPVVVLYAGEEKRIGVSMQIPSNPDLRAGYYPLRVSALSQKDRVVKAETDLTLIIAAFESHGRIGVMLNAVQFSASPGTSLSIPISLLNRGLEADVFTIVVKGLPADWFSLSVTDKPLEPGETRLVSFEIHPPVSPTTQAGRTKFTLHVLSRQDPAQFVSVDCTLTMAAFSQVSAELQPSSAQAGEPVRIIIKNQGNTQQVFTPSFESQDNRLLFDTLEPPIQPGGSLTLVVASGSTAEMKFTARPTSRPFAGGEFSIPYQVALKSQNKEAARLSGSISSRGLIPLWVLVSGVVLVLLLFLATLLVFRQANSGYANATQTSAAGTAYVIGATQTIIANQTAAAVAGQQDTDGDGLTNQREAELGTDPNNPDTDQDGLLDGEEVFQAGTNPLNPDSDADGLTDGQEVSMRTNPLNPDTDGDLLLDGAEVQLGTNPLNPDTDADGLLDGQETPPCPDPKNPDSDQDGIVDGKDLDPCNGTNPSLTATAAALIPTATQAPPTVAPTTPPTAAPTSPSLPRFRGMVLFSSDRDGNSEIYALDDSGHISRLTNNPAVDSQAVWAPNMQQFAFTSNRDGQNDIYLSNVDGTNVTNLTNSPSDEQSPTWSIDGQWIAFTSNRDGNYDIYALNVTTFEIRNISNNPGNDTQPNWVRSTTSDAGGEWILFTSDRDGNREIYRMRTDGSEQQNITNNPTDDQLAKGSPDGALVAFTTNRDGFNEVYSMRIDGAGPTNLTNSPSNEYGPSWSGDQAWIGFTSERDGNREVYILDQSNFALYNITNSPSQDEITDWR